MRLGKAKHTVKVLEKEIKVLKKLLNTAPSQAIGSLIDYCNNLLEQKRNLENKIIETSQDIFFDSNNTILATEKMLLGLKEKTNLLLSLYKENKNLTNENKTNILQSLIEYGASERTLVETLESCYWDTDLIE